MPPQQHSTISSLSAFLIATFCLLALFPGLLHSVLWAPYNSITGYYFPAPAPLISVLCTSPNICVAPTDMSWSVILSKTSNPNHHTHPSLQVPEVTHTPFAVARLVPHNRRHHQTTARDQELQDRPSQSLRATYIVRPVTERELGPGCARGHERCAGSHSA